MSAGWGYLQIHSGPRSGAHPMPPTREKKVDPEDDFAAVPPTFSLRLDPSQHSYHELHQIPVVGLLPCAIFRPEPYNSRRPSIFQEKFQFRQVKGYVIRPTRCCVDISRK